MANTFPISLKEAARRSGIEIRVVSVLVDTDGIPTNSSELNGNARLLDRDGYDRLLAANARRLRNRAKGRPARVAS